MNNGWVRIHRRLLDWEWFKTPGMLNLFLYLILEATHSGIKWEGKYIEPGQLVTTVKKLSKNLKLSTQQIKTGLLRLEATREINKQTTNKYSIITINKFSTYQREDFPNNKHFNKRITNKPPDTFLGKNKNYTTNLPVVPLLKKPPSPPIKPPKKKTSVPDIFPVNPKMEAWAKENNLVYANLKAETEKMQDWARAKDVRRKDWLATWRNWIRKADEMGRINLNRQYPYGIPRDMDPEYEAKEAAAIAQMEKLEKEVEKNGHANLHQRDGAARNSHRQNPKV